MKLTDINLKEQSLETLKLLMDYTNYFLLELNEQLQYYNRGMIIHEEKFNTNVEHFNKLIYNLSGEDLESFNYIKTINDENFELATITITNLSNLLIEQMSFLKSIINEVTLRA